VFAALLAGSGATAPLAAQAHPDSVGVRFAVHHLLPGSTRHRLVTAAYVGLGDSVLRVDSLSSACLDPGAPLAPDTGQIPEPDEIIARFRTQLAWVRYSAMSDDVTPQLPDLLMALALARGKQLGDDDLPRLRRALVYRDPPVLMLRCGPLRLFLARVPDFDGLLRWMRPAGAMAETLGRRGPAAAPQGVPPARP
jgi:hypothetical protein